MATVGVVLLLLLLAPFLAAADMLCDNRKAALVTLPNNTSSSPVRFATAAFGRAPDIVYAFTICRGDIVGVTERGRLGLAPALDGGGCCCAEGGGGSWFQDDQAAAAAAGGGGEQQQDQGVGEVR